MAIPCLVPCSVEISVAAAVEAELSLLRKGQTVDTTLCPGRIECARACTCTMGDCRVAL